MSRLLRALIVLPALLVGPLAFAGTPLPGAAADPRIVFPVDGPTSYRDDFGEPRAGHTHQGNDIMGYRLEHELATESGVITWAFVDDGTATQGNALLLRGDSGFSYYYMHINNDTPGTNDNANPPQWRFAPGIGVGSRVVAGQFLAYLGESGDAEATAPHLHFEVHPPLAGAYLGPATDPFPFLQAADHRGQFQARALIARPQGGSYVLGSDGSVHAGGGAPDFGDVPLPPGLGRAMAVMPDGQGYVVLDGWGGVHKFGSAATGVMGGLATPYWPGWDIARGIAVTPSGRGLVVLDGWGGVHAVGDAPAGGAPAAYWPGWDIARAVALTPDGTGSYVLDGWGGLHPGGTARVPAGAAYWPGWDIARALAVTPDGAGLAVLDGWGGVHPLGSAPAALGLAWQAGSDATGLAYTGGQYQVLDGFGTARRG